MKKYFFISLALILSGCDGNSDSEIKEYFKCGFVSTNLGISGAEKEIAESMAKYIHEHRISGSPEMVMKLSQEVQDDLALYSLNANGKLKKLLDVYNSSTCQSMHKQGKASPEMY